ncbi:MAG: T9SS type A sorting domain-containing protein [Spirochaetia bacterium]|nr:T9SS type A sorting domain-containing protein [Spirochaetia bacterium]
MKKILRSLLMVLLVTFTLTPVFATVTSVSITSVTPASPAPGDLVQVIFNYCAGPYEDTKMVLAVSTNSSFMACNTAGQEFKVSEGGMDIGGTGPGAATANGGYNMSDNQTVAHCQDITWSIHIPTTATPGLTYYILVGGRSSYIGCNDAQAYANYSFVAPLPSPAATISKTAESSVVQPGDLVLFSIDYTFVNGTNFTITDNIPAGCVIESVSNGGIVSGSTVSWATASVPGPQASGSVWFTARVNTGTTPGTVISNTAHWAMDEIPAGGDSSAVTVTVGQPFSITKSQNVTTAAIGETVTYSFDVRAGGSAFHSLDNFDADLNGFTVAGPGPGFIWQSDAGGGHIYSYEQTGGQYPHLLRTDLGNFCFGDIQGDLYIINKASGDNDALITFRDNGLYGAAGAAYGVGISPDGSNSVGQQLWIQKYVSGTTGGTFAGAFISISTDAWYTVKIHVSDTASGVRIQAKAWLRGTAEPAAYMADWTDTAAIIAPCGYVGVQGNANNANYYDNLKIVKTTMSYPALYDTLPTELTFVGGTGADATHSAATLTGNTVKWSIFTSFVDAAYHLDLWAVVNACGTLLNRATIDTEESAPVDSNQVSINALCPESPTITPTFTITETYTDTATPTITLTSTLTPTLTETLTRTVTMTLTATPTPTVPLELTPVTNYPNPFGTSDKQTTTIVFELTADADCTITVFTLSGETIYRSGTFAGLKGRNSYPWDGKNNGNKFAASGVYFYRITAENPSGKKSAISRLAVLR